ncbi:MAG: cytochrome b/b6 domain-containing protein [Rhodobacteraceae bacterium]|nr:cytochrome b/b6 domain-containing protein [Paracoccaceae bacterium]
MGSTNTARDYGSVAKTFHWLTALLIITVIPLGIVANDMPYDTGEQLARKARLFSIHKTVGVALFFVALARILWALSQPRPALLNGDRRAEAALAATVHWLLYGSLLLVPLSGWIHHSATTGFAPIWWPFGQALPFVPQDETVAAVSAGLHLVLERVLVLAILLHVAGALKHHFVDRDFTLRRMLPFGGPAPAAPQLKHGVALPVVAALAVWGAAIGTGAALGAYDSHTALPSAAELAEVDSEWQVQEGTLAIAVTQLGSEVTGQFAEWTADIAFAERPDPGPAGQVDVVVSIGSLTLGSVTAQALGADYFNAQTFPTATFNGEIMRTPEGYVARGPLTIRDVTREVDLPFDLAIADGVARMTGALTLARLDFGIGEPVQDAATLGFGVEVRVELTAARSDPD